MACARSSRLPLCNSHLRCASPLLQGVVDSIIQYSISLDHQDTSGATPSFCGKLRCNTKGTEYAIYDDSNDP